METAQKYIWGYEPAAVRVPKGAILRIAGDVPPNCERF
jgi:hypothetical protein